MSRYIHLNPVKDKLVIRPENYNWSSYNSYINSEDDELVDRSEILSYFKGEKEFYERFVMFGQKKIKKGK